MMNAEQEPRDDELIARAESELATPSSAVPNRKTRVLAAFGRSHNNILKQSVRRVMRHLQRERALRRITRARADLNAISDKLDASGLCWWVQRHFEFLDPLERRQVWMAIGNTLNRATERVVDAGEVP